MAMIHSINKAAVKMGMKTVEEMLQESQRQVVSLEAALEKDDAELVEATEILEETLKKGSTLMSNALVEYISQRKLIVADCSVVLARAQKAIDGSYQTDYKLVERLNSDRIQQSLNN